MSMNLIFDVKDSTTGACVDFPYQTSTEITYAVLAKTDPVERLEIIVGDLNRWLLSDGPDEVEYRQQMIQTIARMLNDPALELTLI